MEVLQAELNERVEAATSNYPATGDLIQFICCACGCESSEVTIKVFSS